MPVLPPVAAIDEDAAVRPPKDRKATLMQITRRALGEHSDPKPLVGEAALGRLSDVHTNVAGLPVLDGNLRVWIKPIAPHSSLKDAPGE